MRGPSKVSIAMDFGVTLHVKPLFIDGMRLIEANGPNWITVLKYVFLR